MDFIVCLFGGLLRWFGLILFVLVVLWFDNCGLGCLLWFVDLYWVCFGACVLVMLIAVVWIVFDVSTFVSLDDCMPLGVVLI